MPRNCMVFFLLTLCLSPAIACCQNRNCGDTSCCNQCQTRCRSSTCLIQCRQDCCSQSNCCETPSCCSGQSSCQTQPNCQGQNCCRTINCTTATIKPVTVPTPYIPSIKRPEEKYYSGNSTSTNTNINNMYSNGSVTLNLNNTVNIENRVDIPINITNSNIVNVMVRSETAGSEHENTEYSREVITVTVPVPIPIPMPLATTTTPKPVPRNYTAPNYTIPSYNCQQNSSSYGCWQQQQMYRVPAPLPGCCNVVVPCIQPCQQVHQVCSQSCVGNYMYAPINPCGSGCQRRPYSIGSACSISGYCRLFMTNCVNCNANNFFNSYGGYQQCGGCFYN